MSRPVILFRADGDTQTGLGHLVRSSALAEMLSDNFDCWLMYQRCPTNLLNEWQNATYNRVVAVPQEGVGEVEWLIQFAHSQATVNGIRPIIVLDGYNFTTNYQSAIVTAKLPLVCIDDIHACHFMADVVINHAGGVTEDQYSAEPRTKFLLGPKYALLRPPFRSTQNYGLNLQAKQGFVCLGGADPPNATLQVVRKIVKLFPDYSLQVVVGAAYNHTNQLNHFAAGNNTEINIHHAINAITMADVMRSSAFGVTSPSTVSFEYLSVGGALYLLPIADNQASIYRYYISNGLAFSYKDFPVGVPRLKDSLKARSNLFDGNIQQRYLKIFTTLVNI